MASRMTQRRQKKATMLVTEQTLEQALTEIRELVQLVGHDDYHAEELKQLYNEIAGVLRSGEGGGLQDDMFDDAVNSETATKLKADVDRVAQLKNEISRPAQAPAQQIASQEGVSMSSRLFARKKRVEADDEMLDAAPEAVAGDAPMDPLPEGGADPALDAGAPPVDAGMPPAGPAGAAPPTAGNPFANLPTELLTAWMEAAAKVEGFEANPAILGAIEHVAEELKNRPVTPVAPEGAVPGAVPGAAPKAASSKVAVAPEGWEGTVKEMKQHKEIKNPFALANYMKDEGYTPHKASFLLHRGRAAWLQAKFAAASVVPPVNEDTLNKVEGQPHEVKEIGEAHGMREGVEKAEKHDGNAVPKADKTPQDMEKQAGADSEISKALKLAEQLEKKLGEMYFDAKPIMRANASAAIRDAVESIYDSKNKFAEAKKVLNKHEMQANAEEEAQEKALKHEKKASSCLGLALVSVE
jgi:hypothetical protein